MTVTGALVEEFFAPAGPNWRSSGTGRDLPLAGRGPSRKRPNENVRDTSLSRNVSHPAAIRRQDGFELVRIFRGEAFRFASLGMFGVAQVERDGEDTEFAIAGSHQVDQVPA